MLQFLTIRQLKHKDSNKRAAAALKLGTAGNASAVEALIAALADPTARVKLAAAKALGVIGDGRGAAPLTKWLSNPGDDDAWQAAARTLEALAWTPSTVDERVLFSAAIDDWNGVSALGPAAVERLRKLFEESNSTRVKRETIKALQRIGGPTAAAAIGAGLSDYSSRAQAAEALVELDEGIGVLTQQLAAGFDDCVAALAEVPQDSLRLGRRLVPVLVAGRAHSDAKTRTHTAKVLRGIDPLWMSSAEGRAGMPALFERITTTSADGITAAREALNTIDPGWAKSPEASAAVPSLLQAFAATEPGASKLIPLAEILGDIGDRAAIGPLVAKFPGNTYGVSKEYRQTALKVLNRIDTRWTEADAAKPAMEWLLGWLNERHPEDLETPRHVCVAFGATMVEPLIAALEGADHGIRRVAATALGDIGDARAIEPLMSLLQTPDTAGWMREEAAAALKKFPHAGPAVDDALQAHAVKAKQEREEQARREAELARKEEERKKKGGSHYCPRCEAALQSWSRAVLAQTFGGGGGSGGADVGGVCKSCRDAFCTQHAAAAGGRCPDCGRALS